MAKTIKESVITEAATSEAPRERTAYEFRDCGWTTNGVSCRARAGEHVLVPPGSVFAQNIDAGAAPAAWVEDLSRVLPCPRCGCPLSRADVLVGPVVRRGLLRAARDVSVMHDGRFFSLRAGEVILLDEGVVEAVLPTLPTGTLVPSGFVLRGAACRGCGPVQVSVEED